MSSGDVAATYFLYSARPDGTLLASYMDSDGQHNAVLPDDEDLMELFLRKLFRKMVVLGHRFHDASLTTNTTRRLRRSLHHALTKILFSCEVCGQATRVHYTDEDGWPHNYCRYCYSQEVLRLQLIESLSGHPGYNVGNDAVIRSDLAYHGEGCLEDF
jgi:hypothetical protein